MQHYCNNSTAECAGLGKVGLQRKAPLPVTYLKKTSHWFPLEFGGVCSESECGSKTNVKDKQEESVLFFSTTGGWGTTECSGRDWADINQPATRFCLPDADLTTFPSLCCPSCRWCQCCMYIITYLLYYSVLYYSVMSYDVVPIVVLLCLVCTNSCTVFWSTISIFHLPNFRNLKNSTECNVATT